jgi:hypothetical protein
MPKDTVKSCTYDELIAASQKDKPIVVKENWLLVKVPNLIAGEFYVAPFFFWSSDLRPLMVRVFKAGGIKEVDKEWTFNLGPGQRRRDNGWTNKRYKLNADRHDGTAHFAIGWSATSKKVLTDVPFSIVAAPLTSKKLQRIRRIASGRCPECDVPGVWKTMAMVCEEHGVFLG